LFCGRITDQRCIAEGLPTKIQNNHGLYFYRPKSNKGKKMPDIKNVKVAAIAATSVAAITTAFIWKRRRARRA
jgi:hypothetical protein